MVDVGRTDDGHSFPWKGEHRAAVDGVQETDSAREGQPFKREYQMSPTQLAQTLSPSDLHTQIVGPGAGSIDDHPGGNLRCSLASLRSLIAHDHASDLAGPVALKCLGASVIDGRPTITHGLPDHA